MHYLNGSILNSERTCNLSSTTTVYDAVISDQVPDNAQSVMQRSFGFVDDLISLACCTMQHTCNVLYAVGTPSIDAPIRRTG